MLDHRGDAGIAEQRRAERRRARSGRRCGAAASCSDTAASSSSTVASARQRQPRREFRSALRPVRQIIEEAQADAGEQDLRVDEAGAEVEQRAGPPPRDRPRQRKSRRPALEPGLGQQPVAHAEPAGPARTAAERSVLPTQATDRPPRRPARRARHRRRRDARSRSCRLRERTAPAWAGTSAWPARGSANAARRLGARRDRIDAPRDQLMQPADRAVEAELDHRTRPAQRGIAADRLAELLGSSEAASRISSATWIGLAEPLAEHPPGLGIGTGRRRPGNASRRRTARRSWRGGSAARSTCGSHSQAWPGDDAVRARRPRGRSSAPAAPSRSGAQLQRARVSNASTIRASPASTASGSPKARWTEGLPRRVAARRRSRADRHAPARRNAAARSRRAAASVAAGSSSPQAAATARTEPGPDPRAARETPRTAWPPRAAGGQPGTSARVDRGVQGLLDPRWWRPLAASHV